MKILVLNGGSSTLKATLREVRDDGAPAAPPPLWEAQADWGRETGQAAIRVRAGGVSDESTLPIRSHEEVLRPVIEALWNGPAKALGGPAEVSAVGHRVVHGGKAFIETTRVTPAVREGIRRYCEFAPEHNRLELEAIEAAEQIFGPAVPQVAVFDTQFHATLPKAAQVYPAPFDWYEQGIRRYGFHGISHQYVSRRAAEMLGNPKLRLVTCHLGNGASLAAVDGGRSVDTTMGFTPLEGVMMGTRSGSIDPGIIIYLVRHGGYGADDLDRLLNRESGLKGVSGISGDMREVLAAMDALVFTAGVGEHCAPLRAAVAERLAFLGIQLDAAANDRPEPDCDIAAPHSRVRVLVIHTDEDWEIARECLRLLCGAAARD